MTMGRSHARRRRDRESELTAGRSDAEARQHDQRRWVQDQVVQEPGQPDRGAGAGSVISSGQKPIRAVILSRARVSIVAATEPTRTLGVGPPFNPVPRSDRMAALLGVANRGSTPVSQGLPVFRAANVAT